MKTYVIHKKYGSLASARTGRKLATPVRLGEVTAESSVAAIKKAAAKFDLPQLLLSAKAK